jgi:hypothetical protein
MARLKSTDYPKGSAIRAQLERAETESERLERRACDAMLSDRRGGRRNRPEQDLQRKIIAEADAQPMQTVLVGRERWPAHVWHSTLGQWVYHVPNGGHRTATEAAIFHALGVRPGVSDLVLWLPVTRNGRPRAGGYVELKAGDNDPTFAQTKFLQRAASVGYAIAVVSSIREWREFIAAYFDGATPI